MWQKVDTGRLSPTTVTMLQANNDPLKVSGLRRVRIKLGSTTLNTAVSVCDNTAEQCVLGCNLIRRLRCQIGSGVKAHPVDSYIEVCGECISEVAVLPMPAVLCETIVLPVRTEVMSQFKIELLTTGVFFDT